MVVERTNSWHDWFRKMFTRIWTEGENYPAWCNNHAELLSIEKIILVHPGTNYKKKLRFASYIIGCLVREHEIFIMYKKQLI